MVLEAQGERLRVRRECRPTLSAARTDAVSEYAAPEWDELRAAALKLLPGPSPTTSGRD
jgi:hypothetical protein